MRNRFKFLLLIIMFLITSCSLVFVSYFFFYHKSYAMNVVSNYPLSINYNTSEIIDENNYKDVLFSITNSGEDDLFYDINLINVSSINKLSYKLEVDGEKFKNNFEVGIVAESILIKAGETNNYSFTLYNENAKDFHGEIYISKHVSEDVLFYQAILNNNEINKDQSVIGKEEAVLNEGLKHYSFDGEDIYYFRGNVDNNYVNFANFTWRIVNINKDGNVKLVLDNELDVFEKYYENSVFEFKNSNIYQKLNEWYDSYIYYYEKDIKTANYCLDNSISSSAENIYGAYNRIVSSYGATFDCVGEKMELKVGLLTADEIIFAGATTINDNKEFYLYSDEEYFTMTSALLNANGYYPFSLKSGKVIYSELGTKLKKIKPVITLNKSVIVSGSGLINDPYKIV